MIVVVDGNDGTGKTTLVKALRKRGYAVQDRGLPSQATLDGVPNEIPKDEVYLILDAPIEVCRRRLAEAGKDLNEKWHTLEALKHFRAKFLEQADLLGAHFIDAFLNPELVLTAALKILNDLAVPRIIDALTDEGFERLPLIVEGESKIVRDVGNGYCVIAYKPTIYSFTANRAGIIPGSEVLRLKASKIFLQVLQDAGIKHAYNAINDRFVFADLVKDPPPIETIVKGFHSGTSKHRYVGMAGTPIRSNHPYFAGQIFGPEGAYPGPIVRFDWRNPLHHPTSGVVLADEVLGADQADWYIDTVKARKTALRVYRALANFLATKDIVLYDLCLFIAADGETVFGEISQDCGRFRHFDLGSLDKDEWRAGGSSEHVLKKWQLLLDLIERP